VTGISIAPSGEIIVGSFAEQSSLTSVDPVTGVTTRLALTGSLDGVAADASGEIYTAPELGDQIVRRDGAGNVVRTYALTGPAGQPFGRPEDVAFGPDGDPGAVRIRALPRRASWESASAVADAGGLIGSAYVRGVPYAPMRGFQGIEGMSVLLTGGGSGIGRAVCVRLGGEGARVGILDRDAAGAEQTAGLVREAGGEACVHAVDITDGDAVEAAVQAFAAGGEIGGLVNCAGWDHADDFLATDADLWRKLIDINLMGPLHVTRAVLARMVAARAGRIVSIASDAGRVGSSGESVYAACKGGIISFTKSVAREVAKTGITLNVVSPGPTDTPLFADFDASGKLAPALARAIPMRRLGEPDDYPGVIVFLLSDEARFITGQTLSVSGGLTMHG
jgi:2-hydroxycyclohexanecarboxyl-CoA dehydrogenase